MIAQLDEGQFNESDLVELKVPFPMLYTSNWTEYQRYDGDIELGGIHYNYVKRKLSNDTLYLLCIPNNQKTKLAAAKIDFLKSTNDIAGAAQGKKSTSDSGHKIFTWEHLNTIDCLFTNEDVVLSTCFISRSYTLPHGIALTPFQPPKA